MKTWIKAILASLLLLAVSPLTVPAAAGGVLTADGSDVDVVLNLPEGGTEIITSLRLWLYVRPESGNVGEPAFVFNTSIGSAVTSADIQKNGSGYIVDLIWSGKGSQDIFAGRESASLGKLSLRAADGGDFSATVSIAGENGAAGEEDQPVVKYVNSSGTEALTIPLSDAVPASVSVQASGETVQKLDTVTKPAFTVRAPSGSPQIAFSWSAVEGADGYEIERYDAGKKSYLPVAVVADGTAVSYSKKMSYGTDYTFRLRAFAEEKDGRSYGNYSSEAKVSTRPAAVKSFFVQYQDAKRVNALWEKTDGAEGYRIYRSSKKNGTYSLLRSVKKGSAAKAAGIKHKDGAVYYYKIRAYRTGIDGKTLYGDYTGPVRATVKTPRVTYKVKGGGITLNWKRLARADGYAVYRYNARTKRYQMQARIYGRKNTAYTYKLSAGTSLDFKVRGYEKQKNKSLVYGRYSPAVQYTTAPSRPGNVAARSARKNQVTVSWKKPGGATGYQIYRSTKKGGSYKRVAALTSGTKKKWTDKKLKSGRIYYYKIRAYRKGADKKNAYGKFSSPVKVKVK